MAAKKKPVGRPTIMKPEVIARLEEAFAWGCTDREACLWAGIAEKTLYLYQDRHPEFIQRKEALKDKPVLLARKSVVDRLPKDPRLSMDYLRAKRKDEFSTKTEQDVSIKEAPVPLLAGLAPGKLEIEDDDGSPAPADDRADKDQPA